MFWYINHHFRHIVFYVFQSSWMPRTSKVNSEIFPLKPPSVMTITWIVPPKKKVTSWRSKGICFGWAKHIGGFDGLFLWNFLLTKKECLFAYQLLQLLGGFLFVSSTEWTPPNKCVMILMIFVGQGEFFGKQELNLPKIHLPNLHFGVPAASFGWLCQRHLFSNSGRFTTSQLLWRTVTSRRGLISWPSKKKPLVSSRGPLKRTSPLKVYKFYLPAKHVMILVLTGDGQRVGEKNIKLFFLETIFLE